MTAFCVLAGLVLVVRVGVLVAVVDGAGARARDSIHHYAEGFSHIVVNGVVVIDAGKLTDARPGVVVRRK